MIERMIRNTHHAVGRATIKYIYSRVTTRIYD